MTTNDTRRTPTERIAAMKAAAAEKATREQAEKDRLDRCNRLATSVSDTLLEQLKALDGLPVTPNGVVKVERNYMVSGSPLVSVFRRGWEDINGEDETVMEALFEVEVVSDRDGRKASLMHDDEAITADAALDLATAVVESRFAI